MGQPLLVERPTCLGRSSLSRAEAAFFKSLRWDRQRLPTVGPSGVVRAVEKRRAALGRKIDV